MRVCFSVFAIVVITLASRADTRTEIARAVERQGANGDLLGAVVAAKDFPPLAVGYRTVAPTPIAMDADTLFDCASITKTVVAMTCARLAAQGLVDVDRPFTDYLTDHVLAATNCTITVRDLAAHIGGFDNNCAYQHERDYAAFKRAALSLRPVRPPRTVCEYACINMIYVGWIVEKVTGLRLDAAVKKYIFDPLGMTKSGWGPLPSDANVAFIPVATTHLYIQSWKGYNADLGQISDPGANFASPHPIGNAGLFATAGDLLLFARDLATHGCFEPRTYELVETCVFSGVDGTRRSFGFELTSSVMPVGVSTNAIEHTGWSGQTIVADSTTGFYGVVLTARASHEAGRCRRARRDLLTKIFTAGTTAEYKLNNRSER